MEAYFIWQKIGVIFKDVSKERTLRVFRSLIYMLFAEMMDLRLSRLVNLKFAIWK